MRNFAMAAGAALMLAACGSGVTDADADGDGTITQEEVNAAAAEVSMTPGEWENTVEFVDIKFDESKLPPEARGFLEPMLQSMKGQINTTKSCVTEEQASNPQAEMFSGNADQDCEYDRFTFSGGTMDMEMTCRDQNSGTAKITNTGTYTDDSYEMQMSIALQDAQMGEMTITAKSEGKLLGDCPAG